MAMLAERRRKTKWIVNPTKKPIWTTDSEGIKFGKQLMEKMGWSAGKGLGAKEQGMQEPLKVSYKNDTKGMGFKGNDDDWIEHQDEFNLLLSKLSNNGDNSVNFTSSEKSEIKSLEEKSKLSRARVHYQKFTRGKDLSRYSENDLACILGIGKSKKEKKPLEEEKPIEVKKTENHYETSFGVTTINSGSLQDYFKKKWTINIPKNDDSGDLENAEKSGNSDKVDNFQYEDNDFECRAEQAREHKKKKKRKHDSSEQNGFLEEESGLCNYKENEWNEKNSKDKKSKSKSESVLCDVNYEDVGKSNDNLEGKGYENNGKSKKRKKSKCIKADADNIEVNGNEDESVGKKDTEKKEKKRKCKLSIDDKVGNGEVSLKENVSNDIEDDGLLEEESKDKKKKKKKKDREQASIENQIHRKVGDSSDENDIQTKSKKKKKKRKDEEVSENLCKCKERSAIQEDSQIADDQGTGEEMHKDKKDKKKKRKHEVEISVDEVKFEETSQMKESVSEGSRKKKKMKRKDKEVASEVEEVSKPKKRKVDNCCIQDNILNSCQTDEIDGEADIKNKKKKEEKSKEEVKDIVEEGKKKKKRKNDKKDVEGITEFEKNISEENQEGTEQIYGSEDSKKKKKKKKDMEKLEESKSEDQEDVVEVVKEKKKKSKSDKTEVLFDASNINKDPSVEKSEKKIITEVSNDQTVQSEDKVETKLENVVHVHKPVLFKKKVNSTIIIPKNYCNERVLELITGAEIDKFKGSNLSNFLGYGVAIEKKFNNAES